MLTLAIGSWLDAMCWPLRLNLQYFDLCLNFWPRMTLNKVYMNFLWNWGEQRKMYSWFCDTVSKKSNIGPLVFTETNRQRVRSYRAMKLYRLNNSLFRLFENFHPLLRSCAPSLPKISSIKLIGLISKINRNCFNKGTIKSLKIAL